MKERIIFQGLLFFSRDELAVPFEGLLHLLWTHTQFSFCLGVITCYNLQHLLTHISLYPIASMGLFFSYIHHKHQPFMDRQIYRLRPPRICCTAQLFSEFHQGAEGRADVEQKITGFDPKGFPQKKYSQILIVWSIYLREWMILW